MIFRIVSVCFLLLGFAFSERVEFPKRYQSAASAPGMPASATQYLKLTKRLEDLERMLQQSLSKIEVMQHTIDKMGSEISRLKDGINVEAGRVNQKFDAIEKKIASVAAQASARAQKSGIQPSRIVPVLNKTAAPKPKALKESTADKLRRIKSMIENERYTLSLNELNEIISDRPNDKHVAYLHFYKGVCLLNLKKFDEAAYSFIWVYNHDKRGKLAPMALKKLAECFRRQGQSQKAKVIMDKIRIDFPGEG